MKSTTLLFLLLPLALSAQQRVVFQAGGGASWYGDKTAAARASPAVSVGIEQRLNNWACFVWGLGYRTRGNTTKTAAVEQYTVPVSLGFDFGQERGLLLGAHFFTGIQAGTRFFYKEGNKRTLQETYHTDRLNPEVGARLSAGWRLRENLALRLDFEQCAFDLLPTLPGITRPAAAYVSVSFGL